MSRRRALALSGALVLAATSGCWEQLDDGQWFPQMKRQPTLQAFEPVEHRNQLQGFMPPEGSVPIDGGEAPVSNVIDAESDVLVNPVEVDLRSLENGRTQYETFCLPCHGAGGMGDGLVSMTGIHTGVSGEQIRGPLAGVLPLVGVVKARSDGHIYTTIRSGRRRMSAYGRIPSRDRWDIVNYVRYLDEKGGRP